MKNNDLDNATDFFGIALGWWFVIVLTVVATTGAMVYVQPWFTTKETENTRQSDAYVTSKQAALRNLKASYDALTVKQAELGPNIEMFKTQQRGIVRQLREQADLIPGHIQPDIQTFLDSQAD
jgi:hypothetical protein